MSDGARYDVMRQAMVSSQLRTTEVNDARLVAVMAKVAREAFVPAESRTLAYRDTAIPLGRGRFLNTAMVTGRLLNEAYLRSADRVLLIGAATGYAAALLAALVREVIAVEVDPALARTARDTLAGLGDAANVSVVEGPLAAGHPDGAPYDVLIVDGAVETLPDSLIDQVAHGGRVTTGLVDRGVTRLAAGRRSSEGFGLVDFADADCVVLPGFARPRAFAF